MHSIPAKCGRMTKGFTLTSKVAQSAGTKLRSKGYYGARCGAAVSDTPEGPYRFLRSLGPDADTWPRDVPESWKRPLEKSEPGCGPGCLSNLRTTGQF